MIRTYAREGFDLGPSCTKVGGFPKPVATPGTEEEDSIAIGINGQTLNMKNVSHGSR